MEYCPHISTCPIYENFVQRGDDRLAIISKSFKPGSYYCLALDLLKTRGMSWNLHLRIGDSPQTLSCSHITLINLLIKLTEQNSRLLKKNAR